MSIYTLLTLNRSITLPLLLSLLGWNSYCLLPMPMPTAYAYAYAYSHLPMRMQWTAPMPPPCAGPSEAPPAPRTDGPAAPAAWARPIACA